MVKVMKVIDPELYKTLMNLLREKQPIAEPIKSPRKTPQKGQIDLNFLFAQAIKKKKQRRRK
jgi:hypothetical protein